MAQQHLTLLARYDVAPEVLWQVVSDHEGMSAWAGVEVRVIAGPGDGGEGTLRRVRVLGLTIDEEIVWVTPPTDETKTGRYAYRIVRGAPLSYHRAEVTVRPWGETGSELWWEVTLDSRLPGVAAALANALRSGLNRAMESLRVQLQPSVEADAVAAVAARR